jgi:hypothetical protein
LKFKKGNNLNSCTRDNISYKITKNINIFDTIGLKTDDILDEKINNDIVQQIIGKKLILPPKNFNYKNMNHSVKKLDLIILVIGKDICKIFK